MNIQFMRTVDRRIGVPVCYALSFVHSLGKLFKKPDPNPSAKKILFIELSEMGSIVLAYSMFQKTRELYPDAELYFLTFRENRHAIDALDVLPEKNVFILESRDFISFLKSLFTTLLRIRKERLSTVIDLEFFTRLTAIISYFSGAMNRVGFYRYNNEGLYKGSFLTHRVSLNPHLHIAHNFLNLILAVVSSTDDVPMTKRPLSEGEIQTPRWVTTDKRQSAIRERLCKLNRQIGNAQKIVLLNPNSSDIIPLRKWPEENYIELGKMLLEERNLCIVVTGVSKEKEAAEGICRAIDPRRCVNFAGQTSFPELLDLYCAADVLITNDSGPAHFSSMTDIQTYIIYGPETPILYGPLGERGRALHSGYACSPCVSAYNQRKSPCNENKCLKAITPSRVYEAVKKSLSSIHPES